uniref:Corrinoid adenosyltransferase MMAB n=1 Tax=Steinernema glaseri TaxID=37863 RepID=A0A1I7YZ29_9BILA
MAASLRFAQFYRCLSTSAPLARGFKQGRGTGDKGKTSLFSNERRWKDDDAFNALGNTDELSSLLGVCRENMNAIGLFDVSEDLARIQCCLQDLGAHVATPPDASKRKLEKTKFDVSLVEYVHGLVDVYGDRIPPIRQFILPGGGPEAAMFQYTRSVCRRAERSLIPLLRDEVIDEQALKFLNRLSDVLFVLGRYACMRTNSHELVYQRPALFDPNIRWASKKLEEKEPKKSG